MEIVIEPAEKRDLPRLEEMYAGQGLHRNLVQSKWYVHSHFDYNNIVVAKVDGKIQGACFWRIEGEKVCGTGWIEDMWVEKDYRGLGLAERLLRRALADLRVHFSKDGLVLRKVFLTTHATNKAATGLYEKVGFVKYGEVDSMYQDGVMTVIYGLDMREHSS